MGQITRTEKQAWDRSLPVERRLSGADRTVLRSIREMDDLLRIMWDPKRQMVTVWRKDKAADGYHFVCDNPFGPYLDNRLVLTLKGGDMHNRGFETVMDEAYREFREIKDERTEKAMSAVDWEAEAWRVRNVKSELDGNHRGIRVQVPGEVAA